jgi:hypothetical protein
MIRLLFGHHYTTMTMDHGLLLTHNETMNTTNTYMAWIVAYRTKANKTNVNGNGLQHMTTIFKCAKTNK